jgi:phosphoserine phosphatase RsbU/P
MLTLMVEILLQEYRTHRVARFTAWALAYGAALCIADRLTRFSGGVPGVLWLVFWVAVLVAGLYYLGRLVAFVRNRVLWRLRRRLMVTYVFIAFVPILLILALILIGAFIINGQFAAFLVILKLRERFDEIQQVNRVVLHEARFSGEKSPPAMLARIRNFCATELSRHAKNYPGLAITLRLGDATRAFLLDGEPVKNPVTIPNWLEREEFAGFVVDNGQVALRSTERAQTPAGELTVVLSQPFTPELLDLVGEGIGPVGIFTTQPARPDRPLGRGVRAQTHNGLGGTINSNSVALPKPENFLDFTVYGASSLDPIIWGGEKEQKAVPPAFVYVASRIGALNR